MFSWIIEEMFVSLILVSARRESRIMPLVPIHFVEPRRSVTSCPSPSSDKRALTLIDSTSPPKFS
jgi:hypothetical protein